MQLPCWSGQTETSIYTNHNQWFKRLAFRLIRRIRTQSVVWDFVAVDVRARQTPNEVIPMWKGEFYLLDTVLALSCAGSLGSFRTKQKPPSVERTKPGSRQMRSKSSLDVSIQWSNLAVAGQNHVLLYHSHLRVICTIRTATMSESEKREEIDTSLGKKRKLREKCNVMLPQLNSPYKRCPHKHATGHEPVPLGW